MIKKLNKAQETKLSEYRDKWLKIGLSTERINREEATNTINRLQKEILKRKPTNVIYFNNPIQACHAVFFFSIAKVSDQVRGQVMGKVGGQVWYQVVGKLVNFISPWLIGNNDSGTFSFYDIMENELNVKSNIWDKFNIWKDTSKIGWIWPLEDICIVSEKPTKINMVNGLLHCDGGPSIEYEDGLKVWSLNGIKVPQYLAETPSGELNIEFWRKERNADIKAEFVRKFGVERMLSECTIMDSYKQHNNKWWTKSEYELYDAYQLYKDLTKHRKCPHLKMKNQTTGIWHVEGVHYDCKTIEEALAWRESNKHKHETITIK